MINNCLFGLAFGQCNWLPLSSLNLKQVMLSVQLKIQLCHPNDRFHNQILWFNCSLSIMKCFRTYFQCRNAFDDAIFPIQKCLWWCIRITNNSYNLPLLRIHHIESYERIQDWRRQLVYAHLSASSGRFIHHQAFICLINWFNWSCAEPGMNQRD